MHAIVIKQGIVIWDLQSEHDGLVSHLAPSAAQLLAEIRGTGSVPVADRIRPFDEDAFFRPSRHVRAFYQRIDAAGCPAVIGIKGSEIWADDLAEAAGEMGQGRKAQNRLDMFVLREFRAPLVLPQQEAVSEAGKAVAVFGAVVRTFGRHPRLPLPIAVLRWPDELLDRYRAVMMPLLTPTGRAIVERTVSGGLAAYVYFYPGLPDRLKHRSAAATGEPRFLHRGDPSRSLVEAWVTLFTQILSSGYFPGVVTSGPWGCCVQDQNACVDGGFVDMDSVESMDSEPSLFVPNLLCSIQMLAHCVLWASARQRSVGRPWIPHGNAFGAGLQHMAILPHVWRMVADKYQAFGQEGHPVDKRLGPFLGGESPADVIGELLAHIPAEDPVTPDPLLSAHLTP